MYVLTNSPLQIVDQPVYPYRGLMIDTSRHYLPISLILSNLDAMEMNKLNVLHWHMTDSQSWPYKSEAYPELAVKGAYCDACVYDARDVTNVIQEALYRGIRVVLEVDLPGHSQCTCRISLSAFTSEWFLFSLSVSPLSSFERQSQRSAPRIRSS
jgi:hexosaminidase